MFSLPGHRSTLVALDPSAARELAVDPTTSTAVVTPASREIPLPAAALAVATATIERVAPDAPDAGPEADLAPTRRAPRPRRRWPGRAARRRARRRARAAS
ncbi:MAG: hypothetical protein HS111_29965 [Kofleriaceae bacterium]|nr:hypothetical protein [Kofleriaceae bacterium]